LNNVNKKQGKTGKMVISNLIPFTKLNLIFAFGIVVAAIIKIFQRTQIGVPKMSIQIAVMLLCLLFSNSEAKTHFKKRCAKFRGVKLYPQQAPTRHPKMNNPESNSPPVTNTEEIQSPMAYPKPSNIPKPIHKRTDSPIQLPHMTIYI
jgi:hypothetical protein